MFFTLPWMLLGLLGLPALAAIYWLRSRAKRQTVSSLFLWADQKRTHQGGRVFQKLQTPLTFFLELLAITAIVLAAADPGITQTRSTRSLIVVLDNSFSMQAGIPESSHDRAVQRLTEELGRLNYVSKIVLAGEQPQLLGGIIRTPEQLEEVLKQWNCRAPSANLEAAINLAGEVGDPSSRILVLSDHAPEFTLPADKVQWWSFGRATGNVAFTAASRDETGGGTDGEGERILLEITNFGTTSMNSELSLTTGGNDPSRRSLQLAAGEATRVIFNLPVGADTLQASLNDDDLLIDNQVLLVPSKKRALRVQVDVTDSPKANLRTQLIRALESTGQVLLVDSRPDLIIIDRETSLTAPYQLEILNGPDPASYEGPFVFDRSHPLTEGLSLEALIWSAPGKQAISGTPIIFAGNRGLLSDREDLSGHHAIQMLLTPELSNIAETPDWPILITNLVRWCLSAMPGPAQSNIRLGQSVTINLPTEVVASEDKAILLSPDQTEQTLAIHGRKLEVHPEQVGLHQLRVGTLTFPFACNALDAGESDLSVCSTGEAGNWQDSAEFQDERMSLSWSLILFALGCLITQMAIVSRSGAAGT